MYPASGPQTPGAPTPGKAASALRIALHSLILAMVDVGGIVGGAAVAFKVLGERNQLWLQLPVAMIITVSLFWLWLLGLRALGLKNLRFVSAKELAACWAAAVVWGPLVFVPLHYFTQGYVTSTSNLVALALYQLLINPLALFRPWCCSAQPISPVDAPLDAPTQTVSPDAPELRDQPPASKASSNSPLS